MSSSNYQQYTNLKITQIDNNHDQAPRELQNT